MPLFSKLFGNKQPRHEHTTDSHDQIRLQISEGEAIMLDVRGQEERDAGHLAGSIFISITEIKSLPAGTIELAGLDKQKIVYCH